MRSSIASGFVRLSASAALALASLCGAPPAFAQPSPGAGAAAPPSSAARAASASAEKAAELIRAGKPDDALAELEAALKVSPRDAQLRFLYGVVVAGKGRTRDAIDVFQQLTEDFPELPEPYNNLAVMLAATGELDRARDALENAVRAVPGYALAHENLGDVYLRMAARAWERAASLDPKNESARARLAMARDLLSRVAAKPAAAPLPAVPAPAAPGAGRAPAAR